MRINLVEDETDKELEIVFSSSGDTVSWSEEDSSVIYIEDFNESHVCLGLGSIDKLIEALEKIKEHVNDN